MKVDKTFQESEGHLTRVLALTSDPESLQKDVIEVLERVWLGDILYDDDSEQFIDAFREFGVDIEAELRSRGMDDPFADKEDRVIKDRGDIGEVLGYLQETKVRGILPEDMFAPLLWAKLKGGLTTHGIDGIGFIWGSESESGRMFLSEWKHTAQTGSIRDPCSSASGSWAGLTYRKLLQELRRVARIYEDRSQYERAKNVKWFTFKWFQQDPSVLCATTVVYPNTTSIAQARQDVSAHLVAKCVNHQSSRIDSRMLECNLLPLPNLVEFVDKCYQEFFCGSQ